MSVPIHVLTIEARNEDGDYVEVKLSGFTTIPDEAQVELAKKSASDLFEWGFGEQPEEILVHDSMKHRAEREGEDDEDIPDPSAQSYAERQEAEAGLGDQDREDTRAAWPCADCSTYNHPDRTICRNCGRDTLGDA